VVNEAERMYQAKSAHLFERNHHLLMHFALVHSKIHISDLTLQHESSTTELAFLRSKVEELTEAHSQRSRKDVPSQKRAPV
jgi:hypothetical protein